MKGTQNSSTAPKLFTELFRPQNLSQMILLPRVRQELEKGLVDHLLFAGKQGTGKSTASRIMAKFGSEPLVINASFERGIDVIREKVISYATASDLFNGEDRLKVVMLEECDNLTNDAWASLRATIEQFHNNVRFIANCNYIEKIPEPIQSRFNCIHLEPINQEEEEYLVKEYMIRLKAIMHACKIEVSDEILYQFVKIDFPDMRTLVKKVQQLYTRGVKELTADNLGNSFDCSDLFNIIVQPSNPWDNYKKLVGEWTTKVDDAMIAISKHFPEYLATVAPQQINKLPLITVEIAEYNSQLPNAIDKFIVLLALVYKIQMILAQ